MLTAPLCSMQAAYEAKLVSDCVFYVNDVVGQMCKLVDQSLTVNFVENTASVVISTYYNDMCQSGTRLDKTLTTCQDITAAFLSINIIGNMLYCTSEKTELHARAVVAVSYTHLTLPTIYSV